MRGLENRIKQLEAAVGIGRDELVIVMWGHPGAGQLVGYMVGDRGNGQREISRRPSESDELLKRRAIAADREGRRPDDPIVFLWERRAEA